MGTYSYIHSEGRKPDQSPPHPTVHGISSPRPIVVLCPARLPSDKGVHPLHLAASRGDVYEVAELLRKGANPHASNQRGFRALHFAAEGGFVEVVKLLTHYGACVGAPTNDGLLAVHLAAKNGHVQILEQLQKLHCDLTSRDHSQATPLHYAAQHGKLKAVEWMIKTKVPLDSKDNEGKTAADRAKEKKYLEVVKVLDVAISKQTKKPPFTIPRPTPISAVFGSDVTPPPQQAPSPVNYRRSVTSQHASSTSQQHILSPTLISQTRTPPIIYSILKDTESTRIPSPEQIESTPVPSPEQTDSIPIPSPPPLFPSYIPPLTDSTVPTLYTEEKKKQKKENKKKRMGALLKSSLVYCTCYKRNEILETELRETHTDNGMITDSRIIGIGSEKHPITELPLDGFPRESSIMELQVRPAVQPCPNGPSVRVYPCHSNPRGRVLILNNKSFTVFQEVYIIHPSAGIFVHHAARPPIHKLPPEHLRASNPSPPSCAYKVKGCGPVWSSTSLYTQQPPNTPTSKTIDWTSVSPSFLSLLHKVFVLYQRCVSFPHPHQSPPCPSCSL